MGVAVPRQRGEAERSRSVGPIRCGGSRARGIRASLKRLDVGKHLLHARRVRVSPEPPREDRHRAERASKAASGNSTCKRKHLGGISVWSRLCNFQRQVAAPGYFRIGPRAPYSTLLSDIVGSEVKVFLKHNHLKPSFYHFNPTPNGRREIFRARCWVTCMVHYLTALRPSITHRLTLWRTEYGRLGAGLDSPTWLRALVRLRHRHILPYRSSNYAAPSVFGGPITGAVTAILRKRSDASRPDAYLAVWSIVVTMLCCGGRRHCGAGMLIEGKFMPR